MVTLHGEQACGHPVVHGHGLRRRRCAACGKTWTLWRRRRGRKPQPRRFQHLRATFSAKLTLVQQASRRQLPVAVWQARHRTLLRALARRPYQPALPPGPFILVSDGLWFSFGGVRWVLYLMGVRPIAGTEMTFLPPILRPGHESQERWREAFQTIPESVQFRIRALVSDDFRGVEGLAAEYNWVLQLCHFHLKSYLRSMLGSRKTTLTGRSLRHQAYALVCRLLTAQDGPVVTHLKVRLARLSRHPNCPRKWQGRIRQFLRQLDTYRAYLRYPALHLPTTTNVIESLNSRLRELISRSRGLRTPTALKRWVVAYLRFNPTSICNGKNLQN